MDTSGPAFPVTTGSDGGCLNAGMSLRDWFAGQALAGMCANHEFDGNATDYARDAFSWADAMLSERDKEKS